MEEQLALGEEFLELLVDNGLKFDRRYRAIVRENHIELVMVTEGDKVLFGSNIELTNYHSGKFRIGKGSMGLFNESCEASMASYSFMGQIVSNFSIVEAIALSTMKKLEELEELRKGL